MKRTTSFDNIEWLEKMDYRSDFFFLGSCFSNHMSSYLDNYKLSTWINPFGNVYNPVSIGKQISLLSGDGVDKSLIRQHRHLHYFHWDLHSDMYGESEDDLVESINQQQNRFKIFCRSDRPKIVLITLGTAWVYRRKDTGNIVGNCHGMPNNEFSKEILSFEVITQKLKSIVIRLKELVNTEIRFVFTISPVRYLRDGFIENQRSKARLILAVEELTEMVGVDYFPAYELFMDDLRDYRYVDEDLVHPNNMAVKYIQEKFRDHCFSNETIQMMHAIQPILSGLSHRFKSKNSEASQLFVKKQLDKILNFKSHYPEIDMKEETLYYKELLKSIQH
ncbi:GSCFA domain-containing protein [Membranihabitans marinus]|uniref:GSCFA domain-containing protein n=1 Tax=Membranihabitans marinus TaxID=1227546 RepID=UPI001F4710AF|nr:GSCFA domain-containing protein [Membranihabitans marinus]